ncbi:hypothetical protein ACFPIJ_47470 [Dactylosporangium cerinum]|uniref:Uncharacterized protein n=1 Tax=Dactylosporangium cerinum TaxID=1434730 RepID=A0ABV9WBN6_9ACTN
MTGVVLGIEELRGLVDAFLVIDNMYVENHRTLLVELVEQDLGTRTISNRRAFGSTARHDVFEIIQGLAGQPTGLTVMCQALRLIEPESSEVAAFEALCRKYRPAPLLTDGERQSLHEILGGLPSPPELESAVRFALDRGDVPRLAAHLDLYVAVEELEARVSAQPLFRFLERLVADTADDGSTADLTEWCDQHAAKLGITDAWLTKLRTELGTAPRSSPTGLIIQLLPDAADDQRFYPTIWLYEHQRFHRISDDFAEPCPLGEVERLAAELIDKHIHPVGGEAFIEFILPCDRLNEPVETWRAGTTDGGSAEIGVLYKVVVRVLDRLDFVAGGTAARAAWRFDRLSSSRTYDPAVVTWFDSHHDEVSEEWLCVALVAPEVRYSQRPLQSVVRSGAPAAIWHRDHRSLLERRAALDSILLTRPVSMLPDIVRQQRKAAKRPLAPEHHAGRGVVLLWEDPSRTPPQWYPLFPPEGLPPNE